MSDKKKLEEPKPTEIAPDRKERFEWSTPEGITITRKKKPE